MTAGKARLLTVCNISGALLHQGYHHDCSFLAHGSGLRARRYPFLPSVAPDSSSLLHLTSFSPIRFSGHILCSFSQVGAHTSSGLRRLHLTSALAALESLPSPAHCKKFDIFGSVSDMPSQDLFFTFTLQGGVSWG